MTCYCGRPNCGLLSHPPKIDAVDAEKMWLPNAYGNAVKGGAFQTNLFADADLPHQKQMVQPEYSTRLAAAQAYIEDMIGGAVPRGVQILE